MKYTLTLPDRQTKDFYDKEALGRGLAEIPQVSRSLRLELTIDPEEDTNCVSMFRGTPDSLSAVANAFMGVEMR